jgi:hypothetical protein
MPSDSLGSACSKSMHKLWKVKYINALNAELNPICHFLALLGAHHILHVGRIRVKLDLKQDTVELLTF